MIKYQRHQSSELNALFAAKPYQGQSPEKASVIFLGNDANYSEEISQNDFFKFIIEYHVDGVKFWKKYGVHHPFLLDSYPLNKTGGGVPYHRNFKKLGYCSDDAELFSFVELLDVPTTGVTSTNMEVFWNLINLNHLKWIESVILDKKDKLVFLPRNVYSNLLEIRKRYDIFSWLPNIALKPKGLQTIYNQEKTEIIVSYSFSASQIHGEIKNISSTINTFLKKKIKKPS